MDRQYIKEQAKSLSSGRTFSLFGVIFVTSIFSFFSMNIIGDVRDLIETTVYGGHVGLYILSFMVGSSLFSSVISILALPLAVGMEAFFLKFIRTGKYDMVDGAKFAYKTSFKNYGKFLWTTFSTKLVITLWSLLFIVPGIIASLNYFFVNKIISDNPSLTAEKARDISKRMTNGYKGELFVLELSFIGWYFLTVISFGLVSIYFLPYKNTVLALYYENCKNRAFINGSVNPNEMVDPSLPINVSTPQDGQVDFNQANQYQQPTQPEYQQPVQQQYQQPTQPEYQQPIARFAPSDVSVDAVENGTTLNGEDFSSESTNPNNDLQ